MNEPILLVPTTNLQRNLEYEHIKYTNKRDPDFNDLQNAASAYSNPLGKLFTAIQTRNMASEQSK